MKNKNNPKTIESASQKGNAQKKQKMSKQNVLDLKATEPETQDLSLEVDATPKTNGGVSKTLRHSRRKKKYFRIAVASVHIIAVSTIVGLAVSLAYTRDNNNLHQDYINSLESYYHRSYYDLVDGTCDTYTNLKKTGFSNSGDMQKELLYQIWSTSNMNEQNLQAFADGSVGANKIMKIVNQTGDYARALADNLDGDRSLAKEDKANLEKIASMYQKLQKSLSAVGENLSQGKMFLDKEIGDTLTATFGDFVEPSINYPELIYDGPFSDALDNKSMHIQGDKITASEAETIATKLFGSKKITEIKLLDDNNSVPTYNFSCKIDGNNAFLRVSKIGGKLVEYNMNLNQSESRSEDTSDCTRCAIEFATMLGYHDCESVWTATANGQTFVNIAPIQNGAIIYPDLIKVKVDNESGQVLGFDASHYFLNNQPREIKAPTISIESATAKVESTPVAPPRLALIPLKNKEVLTYEFQIEQEGTYFVYVDAMTGREVNILYVIDTDLGLSLI